MSCSSHSYVAQPPSAVFRRRRKENHSRGRRCHTDGFTLLEMLVSLAIASMLAVTLFTSLHVAFKARESAETSLDPMRTVEAAFQIIRGDLEAAQPPRGTLASTFVGNDQTGDKGTDADYLGFYAAAVAPEHVAGNGEVKKVEYTATIPRGSLQNCLVRDVTSNLLSQVQVAPDEEVLIRGVAGFNLRYYDGQVWQDNWDSSQLGQILPSAVEVTIQLLPKDRRGNVIAGAQPLRYVRIFQLACLDNPVSTTTTSTGTGSNATNGQTNTGTGK